MSKLKTKHRLGGIIILIGLIMIPLLVINKLDKPAQKPISDPITKTATFSYKCPSTPHFCILNSKDIFNNNIYEGFGIDVDPNSEILAAFDGDVRVTTTSLQANNNTQEVNTIYIDNPQQKLRAIYYFKGQAFVGNTVKKGQLIGKAEQKLTIYDTWILFQTFKGDQKEKLIANDFE